MNIIKTLDQYHIKNVYYCEPIKNNVLMNGHFIRIIYSTPFCSLNGIHLLFHLNEICVEKYFNKNKCTFNINTCKTLLADIKRIEEELLSSVDIYCKIPQFNIYEQMKNGNIKLFFNENFKPDIFTKFMLKISGVWQNDYYYGLTYKFIVLDPLYNSSVKEISFA